MLGASDSGTVLVPGDPEQSVLQQMIASGEMPKAEKKLSPDEVERIERWIRAGAPTLRAEPEEVPRFDISEEERAFWAFQPVRRPQVPGVREVAQAPTAVDRFLLARLEARGLRFAPEADRATLARRVFLDLTGLPPSPEELAMFLADSSAGAYERLVDRLLDSPRFGERWARHWLDAAGYADSNGGPESDSDRPWAWRYRDYVIRSLNADKPFDRFITEQLAGDELVAPPYEQLDDAGLDRLIATGFLRMAPDPTGDGPADATLAQNQVVADTLHIVSSSLLGLTVQCAQCHDHRYDPVPQSDYYRLRAVFEPAFNLKAWKAPGARNISLLRDAERARADGLENEAAAFDQQAQRRHDELIEAFVQRQMKLVPENRRESVLQARRTPRDQRTDAQRQLLREFPTFQDGIILGEIDRDGAREVEEIRKKASALRAGKPVEERILALVEEPGHVPETRLFHRGDPLQPRDPVAPGGLMVLEPAQPQGIPATNSASVRGTTGRRLAFARQLTGGQHPLLARVLVNRFWHHAFGAGLVPSLTDFGALGDRPTHPELLDWLASEFVDGGWRLKPFLRQLLLSAAYRQSTDHAASVEADPDNRLLGRRSLRRLDAETLRDAMLAASGRLNVAMFGKSVPTAVSAQGQVVVGTQNRDGNGDPTSVAGVGAEEYRRSVYLTAKRSAPVGVMETFDAAMPNPTCEARPSSTVALQSLLLMNDVFVLARAAELADRLQREAPGDFDAQLTRAWQILYCAMPTPEDRRRCFAYLSRQTGLFEQREGGGTAAVSARRLALESLCHALFSANRFLYVD